MYGFGELENAVRNAERTMNSLIKSCQCNEGRVFIALDSGECLQLKGKEIEELL